MSKKLTWSQETRNVYDWVLNNVSNYIDSELGYDVFWGSTTLAICFRLSKEETLDDLVEHRS